MAASADKQLRAWLKEIDKAVKGFERKDKSKILKKGAEPAWITAISLTPKRGGRLTKNTIGTRLNPRYRFKGTRAKAPKGRGRPIAYYAAGNLRDSMSIMGFRKSQSVFVGPFYKALYKTKPLVLTGKKFAGDGYYAQMLFGSARQFQSRILDPALRLNAARMRKIVVEKSREAIVKRYKRR